MKQAGEEEKAIAISKGHYHQGISAITVIVDSGWSKRFLYAKSGVGIIIGKETGKILRIYGSQKQVLLSVSQYNWGHCTSA